jgi:hypothetical protein
MSAEEEKDFITDPTKCGMSHVIMSHVHLHMTRNGLYLYGDLSIRQSSSSVNAFDSEPVKTFCYSVHRFPHTSSSQCNQQIRVYATSTNYKGLPGAVLFLTSIQ